MAAEIVAYEVARQYWGSPFHRFSWQVHPPSSVKLYQTEEQAHLGAFLTDVAATLVDSEAIDGASKAPYCSKIAALLDEITTADLYDVMLLGRADTAEKSPQYYRLSSTYRMLDSGDGSDRNDEDGGKLQRMDDCRRRKDTLPFII